MENAVQARIGINDPYSHPRAFQYDLYRELLYTSPEIRELATNITGNMAPNSMAEHAEMLRDALTGHLHLPLEAEDEIRDSMTLRQKEEAYRNRVQHLLDTGRKAGRAADDAEGAPLDADSKGRTWAVYGDKHRPAPGRNYSRAEKEVLFSKLLVARQRQRGNGTEPKQKGPNRHIHHRLRSEKGPQRRGKAP